MVSQEAFSGQPFVGTFTPCIEIKAAMFVRFQTGLRCSETGRWLGLFHGAGRLEESGHLDESQREFLEQHLGWFNDHLTVPMLGEHG